MEKKSIIAILSVMSASLILGFGSWYLYKYFRRYAVIHLQKEMDQKRDHELAELQSLGFGPESEAIAAVRSRYALGDSTNTPALKLRCAGAMAEEDTDRQAVSQLLDLNKKMLSSYIAEGKSFKKQNIDPSSSLMKFTHDKIVRLSLAVVELERQLKDNDLEVSDFERRVHRMKEITRQSINHYKKKLRDYRYAHLSNQDNRWQAAQAVLTIRLKQLTALEKLVV